MNELDKINYMDAMKEKEKKKLGRYTIGEIVSYSEQEKKITVNIHGFDVSKNISVSQHLLSGYTRQIDIIGSFDSLDVTYNASDMTLAGQGPHKHTLISSSGTADFEGSGTLSWNQDALQVGDFVQVFISLDERKFFIVDKFTAFN